MSLMQSSVLLCYKLDDNMTLSKTVLKWFQHPCMLSYMKIRTSSFILDVKWLRCPSVLWWMKIHTLLELDFWYKISSDFCLCLHSCLFFQLIFFFCPFSLKLFFPPSLSHIKYLKTSPVSPLLHLTFLYFMFLLIIIIIPQICTTVILKLQVFIFSY